LDRRYPSDAQLVKFRRALYVNVLLAALMLAGRECLDHIAVMDVHQTAIAQT